MTRIVVVLYRYLSGHKAVLYAAIALSTLIFTYFALQLKFEENILALLPKTQKSEECSVAFGSIKEKDKLFVEIVARNNGKSPYELSAAMDGFTSIVKKNDTGGFISDIFCSLDSDDIMNAVYYITGSLPSHIPPETYPVLDSILYGGKLEKLISRGTEALPATGSLTISHNHLFSSDKTMAIAFLTPSFDAMDSAIGNKCDDMISESVREFTDMNPEFEVLYHGAVAESNFNSKQIKKDLVTTVGISLLIICILISLCFKSKRIILQLVCPVAYGTAFSMACIFLYKGSMSFIAMGIAALVLGVAFSYCLHIITHHKFVNDIERLLIEETKPVCLGCVTTIGAFLGLLFTSSELLRDFGIFASLALVGTTFCALVFLPHFLGKDETENNDGAFEIVNRINSFPIDRNKPVIICLSAVILICLFLAHNVKFDNDLSHIGYKEPKVLRSFQLYNEKVNDSHYSQYLAVNSSDLDSAVNMSYAMGKVLDSLKKAGVIYNYSGTGSILVPESIQEENIRNWKAYWTPDRQERAERILREIDDEYSLSENAGMDVTGTFMAMTRADYWPQQLYGSGAVPDGLMSNFVEENGKGWLVFSSALMDWDSRFEVCDKLSEDTTLVVLDPFYYAGDMVKLIHKDFNIVLLVSSIFVFIVLLLAFKSLLLASIGFMPMFLSWYVVQGIMAAFGIEFNLINIMISTFVFGVGVDYSIFVMEGLTGKEKDEKGDLLIYHKAAIFFSAVILVIVTASLLFAKHPALYSVGISTIIGMVATILITYVLQPLLFRTIMRNERIRRITLHLK